MAFKQEEKQYKISILSKNDNTVAFVNLSNSFAKALFNKPANALSFNEVASINKGQFVEWLSTLEISLEEVEKEFTSLDNY